MPRGKSKTVESPAVTDFARVMRAGGSSLPARHVVPRSARAVGAPGWEAGRLNLNPDDAKNGLGRLVLVLIKLLHELLERQALRRVDSGSLTEEQIERLGITLRRQGQEIERLRKLFGLQEEDMNLDLGPLGKLL